MAPYEKSFNTLPRAQAFNRRSFPAFSFFASRPPCPVMKKETRKADIDPVYLFYGDEFLVKERVQTLASEILDPDLRATNLIVFDGNNLDVARLADELLTPSLFGDRRIVLVDQTHLFMGKVDRGKLVQKILTSWRSNDRKAAFQGFGQWLNLMGLTVADTSGGSDWIGDLDAEEVPVDAGEILSKVGRAFADSGEKAEASADEASVEELILSPLPGDTVLIFTAMAVDKRKKIFKAVEKRGRVVECSIKEEKSRTGLERTFFDERVHAALAAAGKKISRAALQEMYVRSGKNLRRLHSELDKLIGYLGDRTEVTPEDVGNLFSDFHEAAFYDLTGALRSGDLGRCLSALHDNLKLVSHPLQSLSAIANEFRRLMVAREMLFTIFSSAWKPGISFPHFQSVVKKVREDNVEMRTKSKLDLLSMKDYPLYLYLRDAQRLPMEKIFRVMEYVLDADVAMKSTRLGSSSPSTILEKLVMEICSCLDSKRSLGPDKAREASRD